MHTAVLPLSSAEVPNLSSQSTSSLESNLEGLAGVLEADLPNYKNKILRILCAVYVQCPLSLSLLYYSLIPSSFFTKSSFCFQRPPSPREAHRVHDFSRPPERQELQLWGRVCGSHDQTAQRDSEKQLVQ